MRKIENEASCVCVQENVRWLCNNCSSREFEKLIKLLLTSPRQLIHVSVLVFFSKDLLTDNEIPASVAIRRSQIMARSRCWHHAIQTEGTKPIPQPRLPYLLIFDEAFVVYLSFEQV